MRTKFSFFAQASILFALLLLASSSLLANSSIFDSQTPDKSKPKLSEGESKAAGAANTAPDAAAKLTAAEEFVKKYPKSTVRLEMAEYVAGQIDRLKDPAQKLKLAEDFQKIFTAEKEVDVLKQVMVDAYVSADRVDDAFTLASTMLAKNPEDVHVLVQMTLAGTEAAKRKNEKYVAQSTKFGVKAIELIEANKKPANMDDQTWANHKAVLPQLYQSTGILALVSGNSAESKTRMEKAAALDPNDPFNYVVIGGLINDEYQRMATLYKDIPEGQQKEEMLKKINGLLDTVIDAYAHAVGLSVGRQEYQQLQNQVLQDLTLYYKYRHNQSIEGLQQLIDKYKVPAKP